MKDIEFNELEQRDRHYSVLKTLKTLTEYLWEFRVRILIALIFLILAKVAKRLCSDPAERNCRWIGHFDQC